MAVEIAEVNNILSGDFCSQRANKNYTNPPIIKMTVPTVYVAIFLRDIDLGV
jgi:hypothetical protein